MPTYEFRCPLGHEFERFYRTMSAAEPETPCPECGQMAARQLSAGAGLLFKGSGFYLTDYGKDAHRKKGPGESKPEGGKAEGGSGGEGGGGAEGKASESGSSEAKSSESKPAEPKPAETKPSSPKPSAGE